MQSGGTTRATPSAADRPLANPERSWTHVTAPLERAEVETRIGDTSEELTLLSGGLANRNVRVGRDRVLRILRDPRSSERSAR